VHKKEAGTFKRTQKLEDHKWIFDADDLAYVMSSFQEESNAIALLAQMGGKEGVAYALRTDLYTGLGKDEVTDEDALAIRRKEFGSNELTVKPPIPFWRLCLDEFADPMIRVLCVAGFASIIAGAIERPEDGWVDGLAVLLAVVIVVSVGGLNNWQKEKQFRKQEEESKKKWCIVLRDEQEKKIPFGEVVIGDLVVLRDGFTVPADGIFVFGTDNLKAQEAGLTGESKELSKNRFHPLLMKGTNIVSGEGTMIAVAVGDKTEWGKLMLKLKDDRDNTPLQDKLEKLGAQIGWGGTAVAIALFLILIITWAVGDRTDPARHIIEAIIVSISIVVVAVPEGLPLAVTIALAYSMKKMLLDNNFVRHLQACETMGNATTICSDKTGTLTTNKMSVSKCHLYGTTPFLNGLPTRDDLTTIAYKRVSVSVCTNTKSFQDEPKSDAERKAIAEGKMKAPLTGGNQTDCAILQWVIDLGAEDYHKIRGENKVVKFFPFDSKVKRSSVLCRETLQGDAEANANKFVMYVKGAAEQILSLCSQRMDKDGEVHALDDDNKADIHTAMDTMTRSGLRCLAVCYRMFNENDIPWKSKVAHTLDDTDAEELFADMVWLACVGIADPVRAEVPDAVRTCQRAGIVVRMVTGDHLETAKHIAKQCGILTCKEHVAMTGGEFRELSDEDRADMLPRLRVLARSKPADKEELVNWYKKFNTPKDIVAVTGDGANDALALKQADVGLSMGIQGTDVAKEASDIIIMDDNFASIEKTVMWGRSVYDNIRKFVQFQLTVNVTALTISLVGAFYPPWQNPLTAVQLLWINLIMDTMAALALATEQPTRELLNRHPFKKDSHLITQTLWRFVFGHSLYQLPVLIVTLIMAPQWFPNMGEGNEVPDERTGRYTRHLTLVFNVFVWMQVFNEINARKVNNDRNVFRGVLTNKIYWFVMIVTFIAQVLIIELGGEFTATTSLTAEEWGYCLAFGAGEWIWHQVVMCIPINENDGIQEVDSKVLFKQDPEFHPNYQVKVE